MNINDENDGELALFTEEMRQEQPRLHALLSKSRRPIYKKIDLQTVRMMVKARNEMADLLREFAVRHPEDKDLTRRARRFL